MQELSDQELVQRHLSSQQRSFVAFTEIVRRYEPRIFRFCLNYLKSQQLAQEITQEVFVTVFNQLKSLKDGSKLKSWIFTIASNKCNDCYKKQRRQQKLTEEVRKELSLEDQETSPLGPSPLEEQIDRLRDCIASLKEVEQDILSLHYFSELSIADIASYLDLSESAVKMRLSRARDKVQVKMKKSDHKQNYWSKK